MKIGELAQRSGLAPSRIRFYERIGLLKPAQREANGYRRYAEDAALLLQLVAAGQKAGFSLDELRAVLPPDLGPWDAAPLLDALRRKVQDLDTLQAQLATSRAQLLAFITQIEQKPADVDCASHARQLLGRMREGEGQDEAAPARGPARRRAASRAPVQDPPA